MISIKGGRERAILIMMNGGRFFGFLPVVALCGVLLSCSKTLAPYTPESTDEPRLNERLGGQPHSPLQPPLILSEEQIKQRIKANRTAPIDYRAGSAGGISLQTRFEESWNILSPPIGGNYNIKESFIYKEGLIVQWSERRPRAPVSINLNMNYRGTIDLGPYIGQAGGSSLGDDFSNWFEKEPTQQIQDFVTHKMNNDFLIADKIFLLTIFTSINNMALIPPLTQNKLLPYLQELKIQIKGGMSEDEEITALKQLAGYEITELMGSLPIDFSEIQEETALRFQRAELMPHPQETFQGIMEAMHFYQLHAHKILSFNETQALLAKDQKAKRFIVEIYKHLENTDQNCLEAELCSISLKTERSPLGGRIHVIWFQLPKMSFMFSLDHILQAIVIGLNHPLILNENEHVSPMSEISAPFDNMHFDLSRREFIFHKEDSSLENPPSIATLMDSYRESAQIFDIPQFFPFSLSNNRLIHRFENHHIHIGYSRNFFEPIPRQIPQESPLSEIVLKKDYSGLILMNRSLIKAHFKFPKGSIRLIELPESFELLKRLLISSADSFFNMESALGAKADEPRNPDSFFNAEIALDPLNEEAWLEDIEQKMKNIENEENHFYFSGNLPQVRPIQDNSGDWRLSLSADGSYAAAGQSPPPENIQTIANAANYILQYKFMRRFMPSFKESLLALYSEQNILFEESITEEEEKGSPRILISLKAIFPENELGFQLQSSVEHFNGKMAFKISLIDGDFERYILRQNPVLDMSETPFRPGGMAVGDKIYLRWAEGVLVNKRLAVYPLPEENEALSMLADYNDIEGGIDPDKSQGFKINDRESITIDGVKLVIRPARAVAQIQGQVFEEYQITAIVFESGMFAQGVKNICASPGFYLSAKQREKGDNDCLIRYFSNFEHFLEIQNNRDQRPSEEAIQYFSSREFTLFRNKCMPFLEMIDNRDQPFSEETIQCVLSHEFHAVEGENNESYLDLPFYNASIRFKDGHFLSIMFSLDPKEEFNGESL